LDSSDWDTVARQTALTWANDVHDLMDAAKKLKQDAPDLGYDPDDNKNSGKDFFHEKENMS